MRYAWLPAAALALLILGCAGLFESRNARPQRATRGQEISAAGPPGNAGTEEHGHDDAAPPLPEDTWTTAGRVLGPDCASVAGADVRLQVGGIWWIRFGLNKGAGSEDVVMHAVTGPDGSFRFDVLGPRDVHLDVCAPGFAPVSETADAGDEDIVIQLGRGARVSGRVCLPDGNPAVGAEVEGRKVGPSGEFELDDLAPGRREITAELSTSVRVGGATLPVEYRATVDCALNADEPCDGLVLQFTCSVVAVRVLKDDGSPLADTNVHVENWWDKATALTDASGFALAALGAPSGTRLWLSIEADREAARPPHEEDVHTSPPDAPETMLVRLREPRRVAFAVTGLPGSIEAEIDVRAGVPARGGRGRVFLLADDEWTTFDARAPGFFLASSDNTIPPGTAEVEVRFAPEARVRGRVTGEWFLLPPRTGWPGASHGYVDDDGSFLLAGEPGPAELIVYSWCPLPMEVAVLRKDIVLEPGRVTDVGELPLPPVRRITGRVVGPGGFPAGGTQVLVLARDTGMVGYTRARGDGSFSVDASWPGEMRVALWKDGVGAGLSEPLRRPPDAPLDLALGAEAWLEIHHGESVSVETPDGFRLHPAQPSVTYGAAEVLVLAAGPHRVRMRAENGMLTEQVVELVGGESVRIDLW